MTHESNTQVVIQSDLPYLEGDRAEKMDVYLPGDAWERPLPAVLLIHGGGWRVGDKASQRAIHIGTHLAAAGYAVFSPNYLLNEGYKDDEGEVHTTKVAWPRNFHDCQCALRFMCTEAGRFGIDPGRMGVFGQSAGGTFALLLGATSERGDMGGQPGCRVRCVIDFYGVAHLDTPHRRKIFAGATPEETAENVRRASATTWLSREMPPVLVVHGTGDTTITVEESRDLTRRMDELGMDYRYLEIAGAPHSFDLEPEQMDLRPLVCGFLARHLGAPTK
ncbi:MAG: alpha/beta hydrolase [Kiritimatiellae bacterium]|jgi:acetyl esterase/lipase|nr:alpha/beta hydrolase [Kiritimatiellia bacterium]